MGDGGGSVGCVRRVAELRGSGRRGCIRARISATGAVLFITVQGMVILG